MSNTLLATKLFVPAPRANLVPRPELCARLDEGLRQKLILVSAPAGFGKTTLLGEWLQAARDRSGNALQAAWVSLDASDNDPARFWAYVCAAVGSLRAGVGAAALEMLQSPQPPPIETILTLIVNDFAGQPQQHAILVLDDYHVIQARPIHAALDFLLEHLPPALHVVITTRQDPPVALAQLRARDLLLELRAADLRFSPAEAAAFLNQVMRLTLTPQQIATLETRTEGWIAGLQLAALSMRGRDDLPGFIAAFTGSHRFVLDYLAEQALGGQPAAVQAFLLQTSILDRMNASLCDAVTGAQDGRHNLEQLEHSNVFLIALDDERRWYRYHHLFADMLRHRLRQLQPEQLPGLHRRASEWFERSGLPGEAIQQALAGGDAERAARLIEQQSAGLLKRGEHVTVNGWLSALSDDVVRAHPRLCLARAAACALGHQIAEAESYLAAAESAVSADSMDAAARAGVLAEVAALRVDIGLHSGDLARTIAAAAEALRQIPEAHPHLRGAILARQGIAYSQSGQLEAAKDAFAEAYRLSLLGGDIQSALIAILNLASAQNRPRASAVIYRRGLDLAKERGTPHMPITGLIQVELAAIMYEWNDFTAAAAHLAEALQLGSEGHLPRVRARVCILQARLLQAQGDGPRALASLEQADELIRQYGLPFFFFSLAAISKVYVWLAQDNLAAAAAWVQDNGLSTSDELSILKELPHLAFSRVLIAQGEYDRALQFLARLRTAAESPLRENSLVEILILQALALRSRGDAGAALQSIRDALSLAEPDGYIRMFVDEGTPMQALLSDFSAWIERRTHAAAGAADIGSSAGARDASSIPQRRADDISSSARARDASSIPQRRADDISSSAGDGPRRLARYARELLRAFPAPRPALGSSPVPPSPEPTIAEPLTEREREVLRLIAAGLSNAEIARQLVVGVSTVKKHINNIYGKLDAQSRTQALVRGRELGLL